MTAPHSSPIAEPSASDVLRQIAGAGPIRVSTMLFVAHPDDECVAMAGSMARFQRLTLAHATDGAAREGSPSNNGVDRETFAQTRRAELGQALDAALARPVRRIGYGITDGEVMENLDRLIDRLTVDLMFSEAVITHAFEGGHIDHDGCSLAVQCACARLVQRVGKAPVRLEFAGYHGRRGQVRAAQFPSAANCEAVTLDLSPSARWRREMAFACHRSQEGNLRFFNLTSESFRAAPLYDFALGPPEPLYGEIERERFKAGAAKASGALSVDLSG